MRKISFLLIIFFLLIIDLRSYIIHPIYASEEKSLTVTAKVPDVRPPTTPILIAPENGSYLSNNKPTFIFRKSTDADSPIWYYQMDLNGKLFIKEISSSQTPVETDEYYCVIIGNTISISLKNPLADGAYSWKIRAVDTAGNNAESITWFFTIDTQAPFVIITQIGENTNLNLSSKDPNSVLSGLEITTNNLQPIFKGLSEPGINIQINLEPITGLIQNTIILKTTVNSNGRFELTAKNKLAPGKYKVLVIAIDASGNTAVLPEFVLIVTTPAIPSLPVLEKPEALLQLPLPAEEISLLAKVNYLIPLFLLLVWLIGAKLTYGFPWIMLFAFLKTALIPIIFRKRKDSLVFNINNKKGISFATIKAFIRKTTPFTGINTPEVIVANSKGRFNLKLEKGDYSIEVSRNGYYSNTVSVSIPNPPVDELTSLDLSPSVLNSGSKDSGQKPTFYICIGLNPNPKTYKKYCFVSKVLFLILLAELISSLFILVYFPNLITLISFIISLDLIVNLWL